MKTKMIETPSDSTQLGGKKMEEGSPRVTICGFGSLMSQASAQCVLLLPPPPQFLDLDPLACRGDRRTFPSLRNFRTGKVAGFARVFRLVSVSCILHGYSNPAREEYGTCTGAGGLCRYATAHTLQTATCAAARREDSHLLVALFDVDPDELPAFFEREHRLRCLAPALVRASRAVTPSSTSTITDIPLWS
jgi:hypothetical protein